MDDVQHWVLSSVLNEGIETAPRGLRTREIEGVRFQLELPRARRTWNPERKWSYAIALGEFAWHAAGRRDLDQLTYYLPQWAEFSDDSQRVRGSCYGWRIFHSVGGRANQWDRLLRLLQTDPESRRAVLTLHSPTRLLTADVKDSPCALALQFLVRSGRVDAVGFMRSNDAIWGLPYDVFLFTMLQELLAAQLGLELGSYTHLAGSMHLYERHFELARRIVERPTEEMRSMPPMDRADQLSTFLACEAWFRTPFGQPPRTNDLSGYWRGLVDVLENFAIARASGVRGDSSTH